MVLILFVSAFSSIVPLVLKMTVESIGQEDASKFFVFLFVGAYAISWTLSGVLEWVKSIATSYVMVRCDSAFYRSLFECFLKIPLSRQQSMSKGEVLSDFDRSMSSFGQINQTFFWTLVPMVFELVFVFFILWKEAGVLFSTLFMVSMVVLFVLSFLISQLTREVHLECFDSSNKLQGFLIEKISSVYEIKINNSTSFESSNLVPFIGKYSSSVFRANTRMAALLSVQVIAIGAVLFVFTMASSSLTLEGKFSVGDFVMIVSYVVQLTAPFSVIASSLVGLKRDYLALNEGLKYFDMVEAERLCCLRSDAQYPIVEVVSYGVEGVANLSFRVDKGKMYAVCGPSGCGKTTLINSIIGLNLDYKGGVRILGTDVSSLSVQEIMDKISVVPQNVFIFSGTLRDNLTYGTEGRGDDLEMNEILQSLSLHFNCSVGANPLDLVVGGDNRLLSGGESQRIGIARALLRRKDVMILDEPTSALDRETELQVLRFIRRRVETIIVISHQEAVLAMADEIIQFETEAIVSA
nr:ABC transporter ATP-binding protein [Pseudomonas sp. A46]